MFSQAGSRLLAADLIFRQLCPMLSQSLSLSVEAGGQSIHTDMDGVCHGAHFKHKLCTIMNMISSTSLYKIRSLTN